VIYNPGFTTTPAEGQLKVSIVTTSTLTSTGPQTVVLITVDAATTDPLATITLQNLRFDVTGLSGTVAAAYVVNAYMSGSPSGPLSVSEAIGDVVPTVNIGLSTVAIGSGNQSSGGPLTTPATLHFASPAIWTVSPFRVAIPKPLYPAACVVTVPPCDNTDLPTTATSLVLDVENIPAGVTVTFPTTLSVWGGGVGSATPTFQWKLRTSTPLTTANGTTGIAAIYDTVIATAAVPVVTITTGASAADSTPGAVGGAAATPIMLGVQIGTSSGNGTATLRVVFGPGLSGQFTGDDGNANAIPDYIAAISTAGVGREIITDSVINPATGVDTAPTAFFTIVPTQTVLLYTYVTDEDNYLTGLAVANTADDKGVFATLTPGQTGLITFYFFPTGGTSFSYQLKATDGVGLNAAGALAPGNTFATSLDSLLDAANQKTLVGNFAGYVIAVCQFNFAHGYSIVFSPNTAGPIGTAADALVLGSGTRRALSYSLPERLEQ
jgi:hypothetical protein